ncbi:MAG: histidinol-phosphatase [Desulfatitalea sp.]|nr:histidinol-phosphatase [Desulfatitalea sp.]NNK01076.1 histidinol-phosphatase [Desulfatitalea sp.]
MQRVSVHGGHSGQFCSHAADTLEAVVSAYMEKGFSWVGITEHMPPTHDRFLYPEEKQAGLTAAAMAQRFDRYIAEARRLQNAYAGRLDILVGFETEDTPGAIEAARHLIARHAPDFVVGSVHHTDGIAFDYNEARYQEARDAAGGIEDLYCRYYDRQYALIQALRPQVVGHFDLIRIFDSAYRRTLLYPSVQERIQRNLALVQSLGLILDFNVAALRKGAMEPYLSRTILNQVRRMNIAVVPGDDSHGVAHVGLHLDESMQVLKQMGFDTRWRRPIAGSLPPKVQKPEDV